MEGEKEGQRPDLSTSGLSGQPYIENVVTRREAV